MTSTPTVYRKLDKWTFQPAFVKLTDFLRHRKPNERVCAKCREGLIVIVVDVGPDGLCPFCKSDLNR